MEVFRGDGREGFPTAAARRALLGKAVDQEHRL